MGVVNIFVKCSCRCQDIANLSSGYFNLGSPCIWCLCYCSWTSLYLKI